MKPEINRSYTDRDGFPVTVLGIKKSGGGTNAIGGRRKGKLTGYQLTISHNGITSTMGLKSFNDRGFKEASA